jgi:hypothetical protein
MTTEQAARGLQIIRDVAAGHKAFMLTDIRATPDVLRVPFQPVEYDPRTVAGWFERKGCRVLRVGTDALTGRQYIEFEVV